MLGSAFNSILRATKQALLPSGSSLRRIPVGPAAGCLMEIDFAYQTRLFLGLYELELLPHMRRLLRSGADSFDVGGRDGYQALAMAKRTGARVVSVECEHEPAELMRRAFQRNPYPIQVVEKFVGDRDDAESITLDTLASQTFVPDFIKLDIEGSEAAALRGASGLLSGRRPSLIIEVHGLDVENECLRLLEAHKYRVEIVDRRTWLPELRPLAHNRWLACTP